ncbi:pseudaminic acid synthase [Spiribacter sp. 218]|uniref:pseudaminic acid synthase n=1 Tax=Spiribacter pallidus TaxID=1987936 RepID=UPI00349F94DC
MTQAVQIAGHVIGVDKAPTIIAEMSGNHNQSLERALAIVDAAAESGAHAIKLQTYTADTMTLPIRGSQFYITDHSNPWKGNHLHDLYQKAYTPWEWHAPIMERAAERGMICFSSPFDRTAVEFLEGMDVPCYKIASFENADIPLIRRVAQTGKPVIMSTGMATIAELDESVRTLRDQGCKDIVLLKCTSTYPATPVNSNVLTVPHMRSLFDCEIGLSDHTMGIGAAIAAVAHGATVIEKHFTLARAEGGVDSSFSLEPDELAALVTESERAWQSLGAVQYGAAEGEKESARFRRSLYIAKDMMAGERLTEENLRIVRPGYGLAPRYYEILIGRRVNKDLTAGVALDWSMLD